MSDINQQIRNRIDGFVNELSELVRQAALESVKDALGGRGAPAAPAPRAPSPAPRRVAPAPSPSPAASRRRGGKRSAEQIEALTNDILNYIAANPGQGVEMIAKGLNTDTKELTLPIKKLLQTGQLETQGQKRATKYYVAGAGGADEAPAARPIRRRKTKAKRGRGRR